MQKKKIHHEQNSKALEKTAPNRAGVGEEGGESDRGAGVGGEEAGERLCGGGPDRGQPPLISS